ncbi:MAG: 5-formyltetrahydrofolate cyclo-ligase [Desulfobacteraceae bacterium 4572_35.1]|nr:MAG: 5-formyltetrahydrofolate cyclo-ligase [Desulfobacteraceae bacterium 4572_35.1]
MPKQRIRQSQLSVRGDLSPEKRALLSKRAQQRMTGQQFFADAQVVALYSPIRGEVDTSLLLSAAMVTGKRVVFPRVIANSGNGSQCMEFVEIEVEQGLQLGAFGVLEPQGTTVVGVAEIDLVVVPGVAFDRSGHRLGYGKGYYDRAMHVRSQGCVLAGLAYAFQVAQSLPSERHDLVLDWLITDRETLSFDGVVK